MSTSFQPAAGRSSDFLASLLPQAGHRERCEKALPKSLRYTDAQGCVRMLLAAQTTTESGTLSCSHPHTGSQKGHSQP